MSVDAGSNGSSAKGKHIDPENMPCCWLTFPEAW